MGLTCRPVADTPFPGVLHPCLRTAQPWGLAYGCSLRVLSTHQIPLSPASSGYQGSGVPSSRSFSRRTSSRDAHTILSSLRAIRSSKPRHIGVRCAVNVAIRSRRLFVRNQRGSVLPFCGNWGFDSISKSPLNSVVKRGDASTRGVRCTGAVGRSTRLVGGSKCGVLFPCGGKAGEQRFFDASGRWGIGQPQTLPSCISSGRGL